MSEAGCAWTCCKVHGARIYEKHRRRSSYVTSLLHYNIGEGVGACDRRGDGARRCARCRRNFLAVPAPVEPEPLTVESTMRAASEERSEGHTLQVDSYGPPTSLMMDHERRARSSSLKPLAITNGSLDRWETILGSLENMLADDERPSHVQVTDIVNSNHHSRVFVM